MLCYVWGTGYFVIVLTFPGFMQCMEQFSLDFIPTTYLNLNPNLNLLALFPNLKPDPDSKMTLNQRWNMVMEVDYWLWLVKVEKSTLNQHCFMVEIAHWNANGGSTLNQHCFMVEIDHWNWHEMPTLNQRYFNDCYLLFCYVILFKTNENVKEMNACVHLFLF